MSGTLPAIDERLAGWIASQPMFFVATAPLARDGHLNLSPKGPIDTLRVLGPRSVAYLDLIGSGAETIAHLRENGRVVIMLSAFRGPPRIVRLHGRGKAILAAEERFGELLERCAFHEPSVPEARRAIVEVEVERVSESCGYGVPLLSYAGERPHMDAWAEKKVRVGGADALLDYQRANNATSIDGLPAVEIGDPAPRR